MGKSKVNSDTLQRVARLLAEPPKSLDSELLARAVRAVQHENSEYWDALASVGQLHGNVPKHCCIAIVYNWYIVG